MRFEPGPDVGPATPHSVADELTESTADTLTVGAVGLAERQLLLFRSALATLRRTRSLPWRWTDGEARVLLVDGDSSLGQRLATQQEKRDRLFIPVMSRGECSANDAIALWYPFGTREVAQVLARAGQWLSGRGRGNSLGHGGCVPLWELVDRKAGGGPLSVTGERLGTVTLDFVHRTATVAASLAGGDALARALRADARCYEVDQGDFPAARALQIPLPRFLWTLGQVADAEWMETRIGDGSVRLRQWPDFSFVPRDSTAIRLYALLVRHRMTLPALDERFAPDQAYLRQLLGAASMAGLLDVEAGSSTLAAGRAAAAAAPPWLERIRAVLGIAGGRRHGS